MSQRLISRSPDLQRLRDEGYDIEVRAGHLLVKSVPYVNEQREIKRGVLVSTLRLANDSTDRPDTHVVYWAGEFPCSKDGIRIAHQIEHSSGERNLGDGIVVQHSFSNKPRGGYADYYEKMTRYVAIISHPARAINSGVTAQTHPITEAEEEDDSVFHYTDNATSRAGIGLFTRRLRGRRTAIVGIGGSGAYVLDFVSKTPVAEIHLFDGDELSQHNAFRSPGAASGEDIARKPNKAQYFAEQYSRLHRHITAHPEYVVEGNIAELRDMDFVFVCIDKGEARRFILTKLDEFDVPFIDVGMGLYMSDEGLGGLVRVTTSTPDRRDPLRAGQRIPFSGDEDHNEYSRNIQIAELNALNAALAVIRWKKWCRFYADLDRELHSIYVINGNHVINEDRP